MKPVTGKHVLLVDKPDATQSYFILGNVGISEFDPDRAPVQVVNTLFGGRFTSMFNDELRIKSGYSYGAFSQFELNRTPGPFVMATYTRNATTAPAIDKTFEVLDRLHTHPFKDADLTSAKNYIRGTFPPSLETSPALARRLALNEIEGISRDQFNAELAAEQATTAADADRVIDKDFPTRENYVLVIVGKASEVGSVAAKYGTVDDEENLRAGLLRGFRARPRLTVREGVGLQGCGVDLDAVAGLMRGHVAAAAEHDGLDEMLVQVVDVFDDAAFHGCGDAEKVEH